MRFLARRLFLVGAVLAALAMLMAPTLALADDDDDDDGGGGDRAFCAPAGLPPAPGQCSYLTGFRFDFDASSGPLGQNPTGTYREEFVGGFWEYQITCLQVAGNLAWFGGVVTDSNTAQHPVGQAVASAVQDSAAPPDRIIAGANLGSAVPGPNTPFCGTGGLQPVFLVTGDIVVQDNTAAAGDDDDDDGDDDDGDDDDDEDDDDD